MNKEKILNILNSYDNDRVIFEIYDKDSDTHIKGKINFNENTLGYRFDFIVNGKSEEQIRERIDKCIIDAFYLYED